MNDFPAKLRAEAARLEGNPMAPLLREAAGQIEALTDVFQMEAQTSAQRFQMNMQLAKERNQLRVQAGKMKAALLILQKDKTLTEVEVRHLIERATRETPTLTPQDIELAESHCAEGRRVLANGRYVGPCLDCEGTGCEG